MRTTDKEELLVRRAKSGDSEAFGQLVQIYQNQILYLAYDFMGDYEQARDIAQDIFMKAFNGIDSFEQRSSFGTWLKRIAVNTCKDALRKKQRMPEKTNLKPQLTSPENADRSDGHRDIIKKGFINLSANQKTAVVLRYFHGETISQIAEIMNINENTVRIHIHRAVQKIRQSLRK